ncbi:polyphosphate kinase 2 [Helicobacter himalayensis]|uniref:polyphosphate kinase 2 n=1 Tax=Helicobacter himalayensis TaxID=1591088 RepID=UPI0008304FC2|nr:polyphosphate kinase 2 [Helicobacter himalayensis]
MSKEKQLVIRPENELDLKEVYKAKNGRMKESFYEQELQKLHIELCKLQNWVKKHNKKIAILFEGRDAAGKGGTIKALKEHLNPRGCRTVALPKPSDVERTEWYFKRYISTLPSGGEIVFYDRSWYNRAGVERVMGFCSQEQYKEFITQVANLEHMLIASGTMIFKYFLDVGKDEQKRRILRRKTDPLRMWKLSSIDDKSLSLWNEYTEAFEKMFARTHTHFCPWVLVNTNDKKRARLNIARDLLSKIDYEEKDQTRVCLLPDPHIVWQYSEYQHHNDDPTQEILRQFKEHKKAEKSQKKKDKKLQAKEQKESKKELAKSGKDSKQKELKVAKENKESKADQESKAKDF